MGGLNSSDAPGLEQVSRIVAVSSCKGGVGKSTVAVNTAFAMAASGLKVGLFDADIYGPSLTTLVNVEDTTLRVADDLVIPLERDGVRMMSFGWATQRKDEAAIMRGPMVSGVIRQLLATTRWGELDYLVLDLPPGTGDIQLTLTQIVPIRGAVIVTTPQDLSFVDVVKGIRMFQRLKVPTLGVVENMSYFVCDNCGARSHPFGSGARKKLIEQFGIESAFELPIDPMVSRMGDRGTPVVVSEPDSELSGSFRRIAEAVAAEVDRLEKGAVAPPEVEYDESENRIAVSWEEESFSIEPRDLRRRCPCALCQDEHSGKPKMGIDDIPEDLHPTSISPMGNYAVAIDWSDGHNSIYPHEKLRD
ncbi:MAG: P-loop NTPase [Polyangia bacterium]